MSKAGLRNLGLMSVSTNEFMIFFKATRSLNLMGLKEATIGGCPVSLLWFSGCVRISSEGSHVLSTFLEVRLHAPSFTPSVSSTLLVHIFHWEKTAAKVPGFRLAYLPSRPSIESGLKWQEIVAGAVLSCRRTPPFWRLVVVLAKSTN